MVAIIVPNAEYLKEWIKSHGMEGKEAKEVVETEEFRAEVQN